MKALHFIKMEGSGNDFAVVDLPGGDLKKLAMAVPAICDRKYGVGADGVLFLQPSKKADVRMRIFNADGSEAEMCGNGARCAALRASSLKKKKNLSLETKAGIVEAQVKNRSVRLKMTDPVDVKLDMHVKAGGQDYEVDYINTGVPHAIIEVDSVENAPVVELGRAVRHHDIFSPAGTNVDFIQSLSPNKVLLRTYERGVEDETLACGTGSVAAAIINVMNHEGCGKDVHLRHQVEVKTRSGESLLVEFSLSKKKVFDVWLEGRARIVFEGKYFLD